MKKRIVLISILALSVHLFAQTERPISLRGSVGYGYNYTYRSYATIDLSVNAPINPFFELDASARMLTANVYTLSTSARPKFALPVGHLFLDTRLVYNIVTRAQMHDFAASFSLGYKMDYVTVEVGMFSRLMSEFHRNWHTENELLVEPVSLSYLIEARVRPSVSPWNINLRFSNFNDYQIERMWQPMFLIGGRYDIPIRNPFTIWADVEFKPTGMFHLDASFYGVTARVGVEYKF